MSFPTNSNAASRLRDVIRTDPLDDSGIISRRSLAAKVSTIAHGWFAYPRQDPTARLSRPHYPQLLSICHLTHYTAKREQAAVYRPLDRPAQGVGSLLQFSGIPPRVLPCCSRGPRIPMFPVNCLGPGRNTRSLVVISFTLSVCISTYLVGLYLPDASQTNQCHSSSRLSTPCAYLIKRVAIDKVIVSPKWYRGTRTRPGLLR